MKVFVIGLAILAAAVGGGVGYTALKTGQPIGFPSSEQNERLAAGKNASSDGSAIVLNGETDPFDNELENETTDSGDRTSNPTNTDDTSASNTEQQSPTSENRTARTPAPVEVEAGDIVITEDELNQLVTKAIASQPRTAPILDVAKEINTTLDDGRIESSMVVNINELPLSELPPEAQNAVEQMTKTFPFLANRDVYLGIEGRPTVANGNISLADANIKFGQLTLPVSNVASQIGVSQTDIEQQLNAVLAQQGLTPESIEVDDQKIVIKGL